jgi:nucleotide-binding universal stress UspA family protein
MEVRAGALFDPVRIVNPIPREAVLDRLREALGDAGVPTDMADAAAEAGETTAMIVDQAIARRADLLVLGTHGRGPVERFMLGSVAAKVLRKSPCPVLTVPPHAPAWPSGEVTFQKILCAFDFSPASMLALGFALDLARRARSPVTVVHAIEWLAEEALSEIAHPEFRRSVVEDSRGRLQAIIAAEEPVDAGVEIVIAAGRAHREIAAVAKVETPGLIVMGAHGRGGAALGAFGSTTDQVVRAAACPVLTVRDLPLP